MKIPDCQYSTVQYTLFRQNAIVRVILLHIGNFLQLENAVVCSWARHSHVVGIPGCAKCQN